MSKKKAYIGYDLGDGETITDLAALEKDQVSQSVHIHFDAMVMPDNNTPGQAIPSVYGYCGDKIVFASTILEDPEMVRDVHVNFKRRPSDLIKNISEDRKGKIISLLEKNWPDSMQCPELYNDQMQQFSDAVITFTNAIFAEEKYQQKIADAAFECDEIVFCVGHPTKWNELDVAIYKGILRKSVLGSKKFANKATSLVLAAESRAAFLHIKNQGKTNALPKGTVALLIDVGSSTVDITAMTEDSRNHVYNSGNNYLGARCVDFAIQKWYGDQLKKDPEEWANHLKLMEYNPSMKKSLTLACRMAKEKCYSTSVARATIPDDFGAKAKITAEDINKLISTIPVAQLLKERTVLPAEVERFMGNRSYSAVFREFMESEKKTMDKAGIKVGRVILTGSASQMGFVRAIVQEVFGGKQVLMDMDPSRSISMGLALVGPSNEKSEEFVKQVDVFIKEKVPTIVERNISDLAEKIAPIIVGDVKRIVKYHVNRWREGKIDTLSGMMRKIEEDCSQQTMSKRLENNADYKNAINDWITGSVSTDIALELQGISRTYGVSNLTIRDCNITVVPKVNIPGGLEFPLDDFLEILNAVLDMIIGIISLCIMPTIIYIVVGVLALVSVDLAYLVALLISAIPGGFPVVVGILGVTLAAALINGADNIKDVVSRKIKDVKIQPVVLRKVMTDAKLDKELQKANMNQKIINAIQEEKVKKQVSESVADGLEKLIRKRAEEIKYMIESK